MSTQGALDLTQYRDEFPITRDYVYLNHAGVAPTSIRVCKAIGRWMDDLATKGVDFDAWRQCAFSCRERFAELVGCSFSEVAFVRNTSHGLALVAEGLNWLSGQRIAVATEVEYPSNVHPWRHVALTRGLVVDAIPSDGGAVRVEDVEKTLRKSTRLVAVSSAQFSTGAVTDLIGLGKLCRERDVLLCVDGIQTVGALPIDVDTANIDFLAADSHKWMLGVMGIGGLFVSRRTVENMRPPLVGWKSMVDGWTFDARCDTLRPDAGRFEEGSPAYALIAGFSAALELLSEVSIERISRRLNELTDKLVRGLENVGCLVGPNPEHRQHIVTFSHPAVDSNVLQYELNRRKIVVSNRGAGIRVAPHFYNIEQEIDLTLEAIESIVSSYSRP